MSYTVSHIFGACSTMEEALENAQLALANWMWAGRPVVKIAKDGVVVAYIYG